LRDRTRQLVGGEAHLVAGAAEFQLEAGQQRPGVRASPKIVLGPEHDIAQVLADEPAEQAVKDGEGIQHEDEFPIRLGRKRGEFDDRAIAVVAQLEASLAVVQQVQEVYLPNDRLFQRAALQAAVAHQLEIERPHDASTVAAKGSGGGQQAGAHDRRKI
jgi:hypothetical protein